MLRRNHFALVPPLHLPQATLGNVGNVTARVGASPIFALRTSFLCFEHDPPLTFWMWTASKILTDLLPAFNRKIASLRRYPPPTNCTISKAAPGPIRVSSHSERRTIFRSTSTATRSPAISSDTKSCARVWPSGTLRTCPFTTICISFVPTFVMPVVGETAKLEARNLPPKAGSHYSQIVELTVSQSQSDANHLS